MWVNCDIDLLARMAPENSFIIRKTSSRCSRKIDQMHNEYYRAHMSEEEKIAAEESLKGYYLPTELYFTLQRRAIKNPLFLQRSLSYQIEAKHQRRIQMSLSLSGTIDAAGVQTKDLNIMLARLVSSEPTAEYSAVYKFSRVCRVTGVDGQANFLLPDMGRLALKAGSIVILFTSFACAENSQFGIDYSGNSSCLWSKIPLESLYSSWQKYPNIDLGEKATSVPLVEMQPCLLKMMFMKRARIQVPSNLLTSSSPQKVQVTISAQEVGATANPPYSSSFSLNDIPYGMPASSVVSPINWLRKGQVVYSYRFCNNKYHKTEVTDDFTCPFCPVKCASYKGLECHMLSTHDFFNFEFWVNEKYPAVNVSLNETMINKFFNQLFHKKQIQTNDGNRNSRPEVPNPFFSTKSGRRNQKTPVRNPRLEPDPFSSEKSGRRKQKTPVRNPMPGPLKITDDVDSVKSESSSHLVPPRTPAELQMMNMWISFVKMHRVLADDRISWGCEEFSKLYGPLLAQNVDLRWSWTKYIWTLRTYNVIDARTLKNCTVFIEPACKLKTQKPLFK